ncbi:hypothetical protein BaRGS_00002991 [Batillaria attramentaria]|uniref:XK-related protein n=1 Tax=Batillaria attramentaria TaxID=370345 RepID=A0ABD0M1W2_9CAEN
MQKPPAFRRSAEAMENLGSDSKTSWTAVTDPNCEGERTADTFPETQPEAATEESNNTQHPQTRNPWHIAKRAWGTVHDTQHGGITRLEMVIVVVSIVLYIVDVGTDVQLAVRYFQHGERIYGGLTTAFITVAYLVVLVVGFGSYMGNYDVPGYWWACRITFLMLGLSPVVL